MRYRALGQTGLRVSEIGFGGWAIGGHAAGYSYGSTDDAVSLAALNRAYELGCTLFDTADSFGRGHSETLLGRALKGWQRDEVIISTQGGQVFTEAASSSPRPNFSASHLNQALDASLQRLGVETIDLYHLQTPSLEVIQHGGVFETLQALRAAGKIRFFGVSIHDPQEGIQAIRHGGVDSIEAVYNLIDTRLQKSAPPLPALCAETGTALLIREPLARGFLSGAMPPNITFEPGDTRSIWPRPLIAKRLEAAAQFQSAIPSGYDSLAQLALAYPLADPSVTAVVVGCKTPAQVETNLAVGSLPPLSDEQLAAIQQVQARF